jgi:Spy/CpxP family protein refolding chaperone
MKRTHTLVAGVVAGVSLALAAATFAQPYGGMGQGYGAGMGQGYGAGMGQGCGAGMGMGPGHGPMAGHGPMDGADHAARAESRLADLKTQLKITPAQEPAWQTFTAQAKQQAASMQAMRAQMQEGTGTAPERMGQRATAMQQRAAGMATMTNAFNALYAVLTPEQKAIADQSVGMMGGRGMRHGPRAG